MKKNQLISACGIGSITGLLLAGLGLAAQAATIQIGTGLDASGNLLPAYAQEQNYSVSRVMSSGYGATTAEVYPPGLWPLNGVWVGNTGQGQWISPVDPNTTWAQPGGVTENFSQEPNATFTYSRMISGAGTLSGRFSSDNPVQLLVNGTQVAASYGWDLRFSTDTYDWGKWTSFDVSLAQGQNTITFEVYNLAGTPPGNPTGLIVDGIATVPDGGLTAVLLGMGMLGLNAIRRKLS